MSAAETVYAARVPYPDVLERGREQVVTLPVYRDGALVAPTVSGSTFTLYGPDHVAIVSAQPITAPASVASYTLTTTHLASSRALGEGYLEVWSLVFDGAPRTFRRTAALALFALYPVWTVADAVAEYPAYTRDLPGASAAETFQAYLDEAWRQVLARLSQMRVYSYLSVSADAFRDVHRHTTWMLHYKSGFRGGGAAAAGDRHETLMRWHTEQLDKAWASLTQQIDADHDGFVDSEERSKVLQPVHLNAAQGYRRDFFRTTRL